LERTGKKFVLENNLGLALVDQDDDHEELFRNEETGEMETKIVKKKKQVLVIQVRVPDELPIVEV